MSDKSLEDFVAVVKVSNFPGRERTVNRTTLKTFVIDPAGAAGPANTPICGYEDRRVRMAIWVIDNAVSLTMESPLKSPDTSTATTAPQGAYLAPNITSTPYEFFGPDEFWLNALTTAGRVVVIKEYT